MTPAPSPARSALPELRSRSTPKSAQVITASCCAARQIKRPAINQQLSASTVSRPGTGYNRAATPFTVGSTTPTWCPNSSPQAKLASPSRLQPPPARPPGLPPDTASNRGRANSEQEGARQDLAAPASRIKAGPVG